jgi:CcmD family protein
LRTIARLRAPRSIRELRSRCRAIAPVILVLLSPSSAWAAPASQPVAPALVVAVQQPAPADDEFVPVSQLPPNEQLPAAPLLIAAYAFVWLALVAYLVALWRRLTRVEREIADVSRRLDERRRS